jgi:hypothetical protein
MESRIDNLEKMFQSKMTLMEGNNTTLQNELAALRQKELQQDQENKQLKERLARAEAEIRGNVNNDPTNDSDGDRDGDDNNATNNVSVMGGNSYALPEELVALKQKEIEHQEENQGQKERLTRMEAGIEDDTNNDLNYGSSDNDGDNTAATNVGVMKGSDDVLQNELAALRQKELDHEKENKQLRDELTKLKVATEDSINNDLNYDSSDNDGDDNTDTADVGVLQGSDDALQKELAALKQSKLEQHAENQRLKEKLARMETEMQDNANNDLNYDSSDNESSHENDINYDTECYTSEEDEEEEEEEEEEKENKTAANTQKNKMHDNLVKKYADPNYNSSDNEDPKNDIYLD